MTLDPDAPDVPEDLVDHGVSDVLAEDEVVHTPSAVADLADSLETHGQTFVTDVPHWDDPEH